MVQGLRLHASSAGGTGLIPGQGTKIPHAPEQIGLQATAKDPMCCNKDPVQPNKQILKKINKVNFKINFQSSSRNITDILSGTRETGVDTKAKRTKARINKWGFCRTNETINKFTMHRPEREEVSANLLSDKGSASKRPTEFTPLNSKRANDFFLPF